MLDMVNMAPWYTSLSNQLRTALMKRIVNVFLDVREWQNLVEEYLQFKKRYYEYPFSFACFEALIHEQI